MTIMVILLLILVLANDTARELLLGLISLTLIVTWWLIKAACVLGLVVVVGVLAFGR